MYYSKIMVLTVIYTLGLLLASWNILLDHMDDNRLDTNSNTCCTSATLEYFIELLS